MRSSPLAPRRVAPSSALLASFAFATLAALPQTASAQAVDSSLSFFITGRAIGQGGNLGGLSGADAHCQLLADSVGAGMKVWRAYLSAQAVGGAPAVNARDRIGTGPWFNANRVLVAADLNALHDTTNVTTVTGAKGLTHRGATVASNRHDIMTGTRYTGLAPAAGADSTCSNWTSNATGLPARTIVGHHNRSGISSNMIPNSWNQAHVTSGCSQTNVEAGGGSGFFYCFALKAPAGLRSAAEERLGMNSGRAPYILGGMPRGREVVYRFALERRERVQIAVHDLEGRVRAVLVDATLNAGRHAAEWDGTSPGGVPLPAGLYVIALKREAQIRN